MRRQITILTLIILPFISMAQFPLKQPLGTNRTLVYSKGGIGADSTLVLLYNYPDTANANRGFIKDIPGAVVRANDALYLRNSLASSWIKIGPGADSVRHRFSFQSGVFNHTLTYDTTIGEYVYYKDSVSLGSRPVPFDAPFDDAVFAQRSGVPGWYYPGFQWVLNSNEAMTRDNRINFNGFKYYYDSIGAFKLNVKAFTDTAFSIVRGGGLNLFTIRNSDGYAVVNNLITNTGNVNINSATGMTISNSYLRFGTGSRITTENGPLIIERSRIPGSGGGLQTLILTNDTLGLPGFADSSTLAALEIRFRNYNNNLQDPKVKIFADGSFWIPYTPYVSAASVDSLLAVKNGKLVKVLKSDIGGGGGGGAVSSVFSRTGAVVAATNDYTWAQINKSTSSLADITTRNFSDLQSKPTTLSGYGITDGQPLDGDLTSIAAISSNGIPKRTGANTWSIATAGTDYSPGLNTSDNLVKVTASTGTVELKKSINTLTSSTSISVNLSLGPNYLLSLAHNASITISNEQQGDWFQLWVTQTSGSNTLSIDGQTINIDPAASATTWIGGTWNGSGWIFSTNLSPIIDLTTDVTGRLPYSNIAQGSALSVLGVSGNASANISSIAAASDNQVMRRSGSSIGFGAINLASSNAVTGTLPITNGGTGLSSLGTANQLLRVNSGATALEYFTPSWITASQVHGESIGRILLSNGSGGVVSDPGATIVSGLLSLGQSSYAGGSLKLVGDQAGSVTLNVRSSSSQDNYNITLPLVAGAAGETMVTNGSGNLEWKNLSSDDYTPTVTNVANMISSTGEGIIYTRVGNKVRMDGSFSVSLTSGSASTTIRISLPVSSDLQSNSDVRGIAGFVATGSSVGTLTVDASNDEIVINFTPTATSGMVSFSATYTVR